MDKAKNTERHIEIRAKIIDILIEYCELVPNEEMILILTGLLVSLISVNPDKDIILENVMQAIPIAFDMRKKEKNERTETKESY
jgi:hypothetical protein